MEGYNPPESSSNERQTSELIVINNLVVRAQSSFKQQVQLMNTALKRGQQQTPNNKYASTAFMINSFTPGIFSLLSSVPYPYLLTLLPSVTLFEDEVDNEIHAFLSSVESSIFLPTAERAICQTSG